MRDLKYFAIVPHLPGPAPYSLFYQHQKNELFLGTHVRLCGLGSMAHLESQLLAQRYAEACAPILQKRYGDETTLEVREWIGSETKYLAARIKRDSDIVRKRLETGNFAGNKPP